MTEVNNLLVANVCKLLSLFSAFSPFKVMLIWNKLSCQVFYTVGPFVYICIVCVHV